MQSPKAVRPHITIFGRRNTGKSSLMNMLVGYDLAVVSPVPGTTTDPVEKSVEIPPLGPVVLVDTAGMDDEGELGSLRIKKSSARLSAAHLALLVCDRTWGPYEEQAAELFKEKKLPFIVVWSKADLGPPSEEPVASLRAKGIAQVLVSAAEGKGQQELVQAMLEALPEEAQNPPPMLRDLVPPGKTCLFVAPIDKSAPKARLIAPQVQALRDCLDGHAISLIVQPEELTAALGLLREQPHLLVCDSQAVHLCVRDAPASLPLTTYSILMARLKGDLPTLAAGAAAIYGLKSGDKVLIGEVCAHHAEADDIGRVKIPALLKKFTGADLDIRFAAGRAFPDSLDEYQLVIHCGACMVNRPVMLSRLAEARRAGVPITNYGVAISLMQKVLERSLAVFPEALTAYIQARDAR